VESYFFENIDESYSKFDQLVLSYLTRCVLRIIISWNWFGKYVSYSDLKILVNYINLSRLIICKNSPSIMNTRYNIT